MSETSDPNACGEGIVRVVGTPRQNDNDLTRRDLFNAFCGFVGEVVCENTSLGREYVRAKVAQETNAALRTAAEAGEIAARREEHEANADLTRQLAAEKRIANAGALMNLLRANPELNAQRELVAGLIHSLQVTKGTSIQRTSAADLVVPEESVEATGN